jgi:hypothetical protein
MKSITKKHYCFRALFRVSHARGNAQVISLDSVLRTIDLAQPHAPGV